MTSRYLILLAGAAILTLTSCKNPTAVNAVRQLNRDAERSGSPYRFRSDRVPGGTAVTRYRIIPPKPGPAPANLKATTADAELQRDILAKVLIIQQGWGDTASPSLLGVEPLASADGRSTKESWFVKQGDGAVRYEVTMTPSPGGGTDFSVTGPIGVIEQ